jgi:hypothetical protein
MISEEPPDDCRIVPQRLVGRRKPIAGTLEEAPSGDIADNSSSLRTSAAGPRGP